MSHTKLNFLNVMLFVKTPQQYLKTNQYKLDTVTHIGSRGKKTVSLRPCLKERKTKKICR